MIEWMVQAWMDLPVQMYVSEAVMIATALAVIVIVIAVVMAERRDKGRRY